jgi:small subunit ribosomal protein S16
MLKIRLSKIGRHKLPLYRIVAMDSRKKRDGAYKYLIGRFNPNTEKYEINKELAADLISKGAQVSDSVLTLFKKEGIKI